MATQLAAFGTMEKSIKDFLPNFAVRNPAKKDPGMPVRAGKLAVTKDERKEHFVILVSKI
jgi:hypothetical protein